MGGPQNTTVATFIIDCSVIVHVSVAAILADPTTHVVLLSSRLLLHIIVIMHQLCVKYHRFSSNHWYFVL